MKLNHQYVAASPLMSESLSHSCNRFVQNAKSQKHRWVLLWDGAIVLLWSFLELFSLVK